MLKGNRPMSPRKKQFVILLIVAVVMGGAGFVAYGIHCAVNQTVPNAYAVEWVGGMVVDYLRQNNDRWPQSWDDLRPVYEQHVSQVGQPWTFDELRSRVIIRWDVDVERVRNLPAPPADLIFLRDGGKEHWAGHEPNQMVHEYLVKNKSVSEAEEK
jgi:hypothetical protein